MDMNSNDHPPDGGSKHRKKHRLLRMRSHQVPTKGFKDFDPQHSVRDRDKCCGKGRDFASVSTNHRYTDNERKVLSSFTSLDYLPSYSAAYIKWLREQPNRLDWDRWIMMGMIGFSIGVVGFFLHQVIEIIAEVKWEYAEEFLEEHGLLVAWGWVIGYSLIFISVSAASVAFIYPAAAGSGIPEIIGFLNGTVVRYAFNIKSMAITFFSCACAVGGGLPVGPEGPMIHMGSIVGTGLSQFRSRTLKCTIPFFTRFRNPEDRRNFTSAGCAAGVASAFGAPVGGLLFSMEEVSSFWNVKLGWMTFFCCMIATFTTDLLNSAFGGFVYSGNFGLFQPEKYILFRVTDAIPVNLMMFVPAVVLGLLGGVFGALFTVLNLKIRRIRRMVNHKIKYKWLQRFNKFMEVVFIMILMSTASVFLPMAFKCQPRSCEIMEEMSNATEPQEGSHGPAYDAKTLNKPHHERFRRSHSKDPAPKSEHKKPVPRAHTYDLSSEENDKTLQNRFFTLDVSSAVIFDHEREICLTDKDHPIRTVHHAMAYTCHHPEKNGSQILSHGEYNEVATLFFAQGAVAVKHLFSRNTHFMFGYTSLIITLVIYFVLACWAAGSSVSSGIVVPMLMIGGLYGRMVGLIVLDIYGGKVPVTEFWQWIDPGAFALVGGASFFGGVSRLTLSLTVIMIEITNDVQFLLPIMTAIMVSKWVGDQITHPLYHSMLELKCIPFLDTEPVVYHDQVLQNLEFFEAKDIMRKNITVLRTKETIYDLAHRILKTEYGGFPVVKDDGIYGFEVDYGYITRIELTIILYQDQFWKYSEDGKTVISECPYTEVAVDRIMHKKRARSALKRLLDDPKYEDITMDLEPFVNKSAPIIAEHFSLHRTYILFRTLGLRHLTVVNHRNQVVGVISRKDLMGFSLEEKLDESREKDEELSEVVIDGIEKGEEPIQMETTLDLEATGPSSMLIEGEEVRLRPRDQKQPGGSKRKSRPSRELSVSENPAFDYSEGMNGGHPYMDNRVSRFIDTDA